MKNILIFSNPFGNGPAGKAISIAKYINSHSDKVNVYVCGGVQMESILGDKIKFLKTDERNEADILRVFNLISGAKFVISSQNRFAIRVAIAEKIPCAFLDGLAWFWKIIPEEHLLADIIFWLNYPGIKDKIPMSHKDKIKIVHGITEGVHGPAISDKRDKTFLYLGGCLNPLTPIATNYLDLFAKLIEYSNAKGITIDISTDSVSKEYLKKYPGVFSLINNCNHDEFILRLSKARRFITNGGQTATLEAASVLTPTLFFLSINLSQYALIKKLNYSGELPCLLWENYIKIPDNILDYTEKDAIGLLNEESSKLLHDKDKLKHLCDDFIRLITISDITPDKILKDLGTTGAEDIYNTLRSAWDI